MPRGKEDPMSNATRCNEKAKALGYTIEEDYEQIRLEAPKGYCFDQDHHEVITEYWEGEKGTMSKANAWKSVWQELGTAQICQIEECEWCAS